MKPARWLPVALLLLGPLALMAPFASAQEAGVATGPLDVGDGAIPYEAPTLRMNEDVGRRIPVETNQLLAPAGRRVGFSGRPVDIAMDPRGQRFAILVPGPRATTLVSLCSVEGAFQGTLRPPSGKPSLLGLAFSPDGTRVAVSGTRGIGLCPIDGSATTLLPLPAGALPCGLAFHPDGKFLFAALNMKNEVARISVTDARVTAAVPVGVAPLDVAISRQTGRLFVTNWGGRRPVVGEETARSAGTAAVVDPRGVLSTGSVSVIDLESFSVIAEIPTGLHPSGVRVSPDGLLAAVANANSDSVTLIDTRRLQVRDTIAVPAYPRGYTGSSPTSLAFSPSGERLYVTCGGNNAVAVLQKDGETYRLTGFVPTDWYPVAACVRAAAGVDTLFVANAKGTGSRGHPDQPRRVQDFEGTVSIITDPTVDETATKAGNDPFAVTASAQPGPRLDTLGVEHVFLIIKENRTYDQILGDLGRGDGEPSLAIYGRRATPNQHRLAEEFVTLDNFYDSGTVSPEGHHWLTQGMTSDYLERSSSAGWPRTYPYRGEDPLAFAPTGFLWDAARAHRLSTRVFGEFGLSAGAEDTGWIALLQEATAPFTRHRAHTRSEVSSLNAPQVLVPDYPGFDLRIPDTFRARVFRDTFAAEPAPNLCIIQLPCDHTMGVTPGHPTPRAMVADNDLAVGQIVETISRSAAWPRSVIFIVEDDSQAGVDHVDGHRTMCLVASPFVRRGKVDSTQYNQLSVVRSIEELLGLPPMNKFDASARPMRSLFTPDGDPSPYRALPALVSTSELAPPLQGLKGREEEAAIASLAMDFSAPDAVPSERLNEILWHVARGWDTPYPQVPHGPGCPADND